MEMAEIILKGGPAALAAVMFWIWMQERKERIASQDKLVKLSMALIEISTKSELAITGFTTLVEKLGPAIQEIRDLVIKLKTKLGGDS